MSGSQQGFWASLWRRYGWAAEQEQRQERQAVRETGDAQDKLAQRIHEQKVRRRDLQSRLAKEETAGKTLKTAGGPNWQAKATPHVKRALALRKQLAQLEAVIDNLETQLGAMADVASTVDVVGAMRDGAQQMASTLKQVGDVDDIADVLAEVDDSLVHAQDIMDAVSRPLGAAGAQGLDEDSLQSVFDEWNEQDAVQQMSRVELGERKARESVLRGPAVPVASEEEETTTNNNNRRGGGGTLLNTE